MAYKLEDGRGTRGKSSVFKDRLRTFDVNSSLTNHLSVESGNISNEDILNGEVIGTFTVRNITGTGVTINNGFKLINLSITNNDPINLMVIDRAYVQIISSTVTLLNSGVSLAIDNISSTTTLIPIINENISSNIKPLVIARGGNLLPTGTLQNFDIPRIFPTVGNTEELIISGSDTIIVPGLPITGAATISANTISMAIFNSTGSSIAISFESFIRFMMVNPGNMG